MPECKNKGNFVMNNAYAIITIPNFQNKLQASS